MKPLAGALLFGVVATCISACGVQPSCDGDCEPQATEVAQVSAALRAEGTMVSEEASAGAFALFQNGEAAPLFVSAGDYPGVLRATRDLQADINRVSGIEPALTESDDAAGTHAVLVGTLGHSPLIDALAAAGKIDATSLEGKWETFIAQVVEQPVAGVEQALVIAGSDKRGTIYGIYELSEEMGVSPWHYWADVPPRTRAQLFVTPGPHSLGEPAVKYRGLFINDENPALYDWYKEAFSTDNRGFNSEFYATVFELVLRMKGNYVWPGMWGKSFNTDDAANPDLAEEYGVVMGTSHHEPLTRAEQEWYDAGHDESEWNYQDNGAALRDFWRGGIERMGTRETMVTVGMRGSGDKPAPNQGIPLLESVVAAQREIIADVTGKPASETPQVWTLYKEVQGYYDGGMQVPDDVTLMFADDNWGNIRRLPSATAAPRSGGYGVYYHFDYVGGPRSYRWLNTNPIPRVWEQMKRAKALGADRIWIVNVGDIKPMEYPLSFFMDLAWDPDGWSAARLADYPRRWAKAQFGDNQAAEIGRLLSRYLKFNGRRKPELLSADTYSLENYREADTVVAEYNALVEDATALQATLPDAMHDAFFQLVLHPILACANLNEMYVSQAKNSLYADQGRASTNAMGDRVNALFDNDSAIAAEYHSINNGKWNHMMSQTHIGYTSWDNPATDVRPTTRTAAGAGSGLGVAIDGSRQAFTAQGAAATLPELSVYYPDEDRRIEVFNRGSGSVDFTATSDVAYVTIEPSSGTLGDDVALSVRVDWSQVPEGDSMATLTVSDGGAGIAVQLPLNNPTTPRPEDVVGFVETNGYVSIDPSHFTSRTDAGEVAWATIPDLGRTGSAVHVMPQNATSASPGQSAQLAYAMHLLEAGAVTVQVMVSPSLPVNGSNYRVAVSIDDQAPKTLDLHEGLPGDFNDSAPIWEDWVSNNIITKTTNFTIDAAGEHTLKLWMVDAGVVVQKLVVYRGNLPGSYLGPPSRMPLNFEVEQVIPDTGPLDPTTPNAGAAGTPGAGGAGAGGGATNPAGTAGTTSQAGTGNEAGAGNEAGTGGPAGSGGAPPGGAGTPATFAGTGGGDPALAGGQAVEAAAPADDGGCACTTAGRQSPAPLAPVGALLLLGAATLRRRRPPVGIELS